MQRPASITAQKLVSALVASHVVDEMGIISLLGPARHSVTVKELETALVRESLLTEAGLAELVAQVSAMPVFTGHAAAVSPSLDRGFAWRHGALLLNSSDAVTVALVEDTPDNVSAVEAVLPGTGVSYQLMTATRFAQLFRAVYAGDDSIVEYPQCPDLFTLLDAALATGGDDIHLCVGIRPRVRVDGEIVDLEFDALTHEWLYAQFELIASPRHLERWHEMHSADLAYTFGPVRFRVNIAQDDHGITMALRRLPSKIRTAAQLGLPQSITSFAHLERGLVLVTGPTGSGKTTTLAAILAEICKQKRHIITLEDPIEYRLPRHMAAQVNQRELGDSFGSFPEGLRDALRQDPDVILVGELRDMETISTAITACETGHLVFGTLHTFDAANTIARVVDTFPHEEQSAVRVQLSQLLRGIVSQTLLAKAGESGRVAAFEVLINTQAVAPNLRKLDGQNAIKETMRTGGRKDGMQVMEASLAQLVVTGQVTREEALFKSRKPDEFEQMLEFYARQAQASRGKKASDPLGD